MDVRRRDVFRLGAAAAASMALPARGWTGEARSYAADPTLWRSYQVETRIQPPAQQTASSAPVQAWLPVPSLDGVDWFTWKEMSWTGNASSVSLKRDPVYGSAFIHAVWPEPVQDAVLIATSVFSVRDRRVALAEPSGKVPISDAERQLYSRSTALIPTDGIVKEVADSIVADARSDIEKATRLYHWVIEHTERNPATRGCGEGDIVAMLRSGTLNGKCADINALYVGLARASGLAARDVYGIRVAPSRFGYKSLGAGSEDVTRAQHCRAEVYISSLGWIPVDPADVRKVMLEEPPTNLSADHPLVAQVRDRLLGSWEGNWMPYNFAHDVVLPGSTGPMLNFLMYPQIEIGSRRLDCLDPDGSGYKVISREIAI